MTMKTLRIVMAVVLGLSTLANAQDATAETSKEEALIHVKENLLYLRGGFTGGLVQNGKALDLGFFYSHVDSIFGTFPDALEAAQSARTYSIVGGFVYTAGLAAVIVDLALTIAGSSSTGGPVISRDASLGLFLGGVGGMVVGTFLVTAGQRKLLEAVNRHNFGLIRRELPAPKQFEIPPLVTRRQTTVQVLSLAF